MKATIPIAMWDFSWLERRWPGAGYEDWNRALDELLERGYTALRIDAYPHFISADPLKEWQISAHWWFLAWGTCGDLTIRPWKDLIAFLRLCAAKNIKVLLSTWYRDDLTKQRLKITSPQIQARQWAQVLDLVANEGLTDTIMGVDLCNEFPGDAWAPFFDNSPQNSWDGTTDQALIWAEDAVIAFKKQHPSLETTVSFSGYPSSLTKIPECFTFLEPHIWMSQLAGLEKMLGGNSSRHSPEYLNSLALKGESLFNANREEWLILLSERIIGWADVSSRTGLPLITTEGWAVVDVRDWPMFDWGWIKEICEFAVRKALSTGAWSSLCTSNFCGPQFPGMWSDVKWHQRMTSLISSSQPIQRKLPKA